MEYGNSGSSSITSYKALYSLTSPLSVPFSISYARSYRSRHVLTALSRPRTLCYITTSPTIPCRVRVAHQRRHSSDALPEKGTWWQLRLPSKCATAAAADTCASPCTTTFTCHTIPPMLLDPCPIATPSRGVWSVCCSCLRRRRHLQLLQPRCSREAFPRRRAQTHRKNSVRARTQGHARRFLAVKNR